MSCYLRHMTEIFQEAAVEVTKQNRKAIHRHIATIVGDADDTCSSTWRLVKQWRDDPLRRRELIVALREFAD